MRENTRLSTEVGRDKVLVVNSAMEVKELITWQKAVTLIFEDKAYALLERGSDDVVRSPSVELVKPLVICLTKFSRLHSKVFDLEDDVKKTYVRQRDGYICQYCGAYGNTVDHIQPKSRGGKDTWGNLVVACSTCNGFKADRTPEEAGMKRPLVVSGVVGNQKLDALQAALYEALQAELV